MNEHTALIKHTDLIKKVQGLEIQLIPSLDLLCDPGQVQSLTAEKYGRRLTLKVAPRLP